MRLRAEIAEKVNGYQEIKRSAIRKQGKNRIAMSSASVASAPDDRGATGSGKILRVANVLFSHDKILDAESNLAHQFQPSMVHLHASDAGELGVQEGDEVRIAGNVMKLKRRCVYPIGAIPVVWCFRKFPMNRE